ncbi:hypothetical protein ARTHRO9AX_220195 [Arthrobacter sp. 9AX]|nr:hypothetical protein ARTHRO9AX_220195 [Arthrobacter sp. 9AX]
MAEMTGSDDQFEPAFLDIAYVNRMLAKLL